MMLHACLVCALNSWEGGVRSVGPVEPGSSARSSIVTRGACAKDLAVRHFCAASAHATRVEAVDESYLKLGGSFFAFCRGAQAGSAAGSCQVSTDAQQQQHGMRFDTARAARSPSHAVPYHVAHLVVASQAVDA